MKKRKVKKVMANDKAFIGIRVPDAHKAKLEKKAEADGISLQQLCTQLLDLGNMKQNLDTVDVMSNIEEHADDWEQAIDEVKRLTVKRDELQEMIRDRQGLFSNAPQSLRNAYRACDERIGAASEKLAKLFPRKKDRSLMEVLKGN